MSPRGESTTPDQTLGGLLYGDAPRPPLEQEWVDLLAAIAAGDQDALQGLYQRLHRIVFTLAFRIVNSRETAEEITVDVFHDVWRRAATYTPANGTVIGWVMNQARSRAIDRVRFEQRRKRTAVDPPPAGAGPGAGDPHEVLDARQQAVRVRGALDRLTEPERQAIETAFFSGLSYAEVADRFALPLGTVKTRVRSGLGKLRLALGTTGEGT